jgi:hypothetical protein
LKPGTYGNVVLDPISSARDLFLGYTPEHVLMVSGG